MRTGAARHGGSRLGALLASRCGLAARAWIVGATAAGCGGGGDTEPGDAGACEPSRWQGAPFAARVVSFSPGAGAGFGADALPCVVLGPPRGGGLRAQGLDVVSLGVGGEIVVELGRDALDRPGADLLVFENPFLIAGGEVPFAEPGEVAVSEDGAAFQAFACDPAGEGWPGCAGVRPVLAPGEDGDLDPTDPTLAGGDAFDLAAIGVARARFVRIRDVGPARGGPETRGFDLDAIALVQ